MNPLCCYTIKMTFYCAHQPRGASRRAQALYDCQADHHDELSFLEGQVLVVLGQEDSDWWVRVSVQLTGQRRSHSDASVVCARQTVKCTTIIKNKSENHQS